MEDEILDGLQRRCLIFQWQMQRWSLGTSLLACWLIGKSGASDTGSVSNIEFASTVNDDDCYFSLAVVTYRSVFLPLKELEGTLF